MKFSKLCHLIATHGMSLTQPYYGKGKAGPWRLWQGNSDKKSRQLLIESEDLGVIERKVNEVLTAPKG